MIQVNAMGDACPIPVVKTLQALKELHGAGTVQTLVDNKVAVENLTRLAESKGCTIETAQLGEKEYRVTITVGEGAELPETVDTTCAVPAAADNTVVAVSADHMGEGDEVLGKILLKGFLFALTTGAKFIEAGTSKKVIVVGADKMSSIVDYTDRSTCPLFGDAAAAVLLWEAYR